jgi:hypothetical protein
MTEEIRAKIGRPGESNHRYKGGWLGGEGQAYWFLPLPSDQWPQHPSVSKRGIIQRSHLVWDLAHPDDPVLPGQVIHHLDENSLNDVPENLRKYVSQSEHAHEHFSRPRGPLSPEHRAAVSRGLRRFNQSK